MTIYGIDHDLPRQCCTAPCMTSFKFPWECHDVWRFSLEKAVISIANHFSLPFGILEVSIWVWCEWKSINCLVSWRLLMVFAEACAWASCIDMESSLLVSDDMSLEKTWKITNDRLEVRHSYSRSHLTTITSGKRLASFWDMFYFSCTKCFSTMRCTSWRFSFHESLNIQHAWSLLLKKTLVH